MDWIKLGSTLENENLLNDKIDVIEGDLIKIGFSPSKYVDNVITCYHRDCIVKGNTKLKNTTLLYFYSVTDKKMLITVKNEGYHPEKFYKLEQTNVKKNN